ncbi:Methyltransferase type 11 [Beutenbergia cavernae DSM 12333]|uniref:Methyltransferase type 11 n=1 Tax=Beutenbergia cavernae (strain ATCC BAA-8 / DSM 12333 / CCUG 43141 / JCM 11478 / NBRC 16432 / NCIMB 13614 / HKI 0122) TaxID=471853 RepID=C5BW13_BEUC1|nr:class I SAM-dependent methyltransferase [Beutenbergia cavernae]ACQ80614.1 Methyltransferase type 11 [Beutenbergia cavernae DSM 12333]
MTEATRRLSFGGSVEAYERGRPDYPAEAVAWLVPAGARDVLDLGAGSGKLTRALVDGVRRVVAVDPDARMLDALSARLPDVDARAGSAESIPRAPGSVDAVVVGQAWHWFDAGRASREIARVLRPGGSLGLVWNIRDPASEIAASLAAIARPSDHEAQVLGDGPKVPEPFGAVERTVVRWTRRLRPEDVVDMVTTRSYLLTESDAERRRVAAAVAGLARAHTGDDGLVVVPYVTHCFRARTPTLP